MKKTAYFLGTASIVFLLQSASAQDTGGRWSVTGNVEGKSFTLDCQFHTAHDKLSGLCTDGPTGDASVPGGRSHPLTSGHTSGENVNWTYETSYLLIKFDVKYVGVIHGDQIVGSVVAAGKTGTFSAQRVGS